MPWPWKKKETQGRKTLGFACGETLIFRAKALASAVGTPLYPVFEHCLAVGVGFVLAQLNGDVEAKEKVRQHLMDCHLLVEAPGHDECIVLEDVNDEWASQRTAVNCLIVQFEDAGVPRVVVLRAVATLANRLARKQELDKKTRELNRRIHVGALRKIFKENPDLISRIAEALSVCTREELNWILAAKGKRRRQPPPNPNLYSLGE